MYIKLGESSITYNKELKEDYMIIGEIVDSPFSYENPVIVRSVDELDIWFSKRFDQRDYLVELLNNGCSLYLYKPTLVEKTKISENSDYVDYSNYTKLNSLGYANESLIDTFYSVIKSRSDYRLRVLSSDESSIDFYIWNSAKGKFEMNNNSTLEILNSNYVNSNILNDLAILKTSDEILIPHTSKDYWIYLNNEFVLTSNLMQEVNNCTASLNNRDVLSILPSNNHLEYCYPKYSELNRFKEPIDYNRYVRFEDTGKLKADLSRINDNLQSLVFNITFNSSKDKFTGFVVINEPKTGINYLAYNGNKGSIPSEIVNYCNSSNPELNSVLNLGSEALTPREFVSKLKNVYKKLGYKVNEIYDGIEVVNSNIVPVTYFYSFNGVNIYPNKYTSNQLIADSVKGSSCIDFYSKTIGSCSRLDVSAPIKVLIEYTNQTNIYRFTISRYEYSEVFEGPIVSNSNLVERIDYKISNESKLVNCIINNPNDFRTGEFYLRNGIIEHDPDNNSWMNSLRIMFNSSNYGIYPDYFLVPNINKYNYELEDFYDYLPQYDEFLEIAEEFNMQFLIQNTNCRYSFTSVSFKKSESNIDSIIKDIEESENFKDLNIIFDISCNDEKGNIVESWYYLKSNKGSKFLSISNSLERKYIYWSLVGNDSVFNKLNDKENRLIYFFQNMLINNSTESRPGYYLYLNSILNNQYFISNTEIIYDEPYTDDVYKEDSPSMMLLNKFKSNYLVNNNQYYYYHKYQNGDDYTSTGLMRFVIGKLYREINKNRGKYISEVNMNKVQRVFEDIIHRIKEKFSLIKRIELTSFSSNLETNTLKLEINISVRDLASNNLVLNITVDYKDLSNE